jgi:N-methylhydantoinase A
VERLREQPAGTSRQMFDVVVAQTVQAGCFERQQLAPGDYVVGPALISESQTTTVVTSGFTVCVSSRGNLVLEARQESEE